MEKECKCEEMHENRFYCIQIFWINSNSLYKEQTEIPSIARTKDTNVSLFVRSLNTIMSYARQLKCKIINCTMFQHHRTWPVHDRYKLKIENILWIHKSAYNITFNVQYSENESFTYLTYIILVLFIVYHFSVCVQVKMHNLLNKYYYANDILLSKELIKCN